MTVSLQTRCLGRYPHSLVNSKISESTRKANDVCVVVLMSKLCKLKQSGTGSSANTRYSISSQQCQYQFRKSERRDLLCLLQLHEQPYLQNL